MNVASSVGRTFLSSTCSDGGDGSFVVTSESIAMNSWTVRLHHVDGAGVANASVVLVTAGSVWFFSAAVLPSSAGTCIVVWTHPTYGAHLLAQRFDAQCVGQWPAPVQLMAAGGGFDSLGAAADGNGGAIVACNRHSTATGGGTDYRAQRIDSGGSLQWGPSGTQVTGSTANGPHLSSALAVGTSAIGLVWTSFGGNAPNPMFGAWLDKAGQLVVKPFAMGSVLEPWDDFAVSRAVAGSADAMYVAVSQFNTPLEVRRFEANDTQAAWTASGPLLADPASYALSSDGAGGLLLASVDTAGKVAADRLNPQGLWQWGSARASAIATISTTQVPSQPTWAWSRVVTVRDRDSGGAFVTYETWPSAEPRIQAWCCDANGFGASQSSPVNGGAGAQQLALSHRSAQDTVNVTWEGASGPQGTAIVAQKLGCCPPWVPSGRVIERVPELPCAIPWDMPTQLPGGFRVLLTCSRGGWRGGVLPLPRLREAPGLALPGALGVRGVPAPAWTRLTLTGIPEGVEVELHSHKNEKIAVAETVSGPTRTRQPLRSLTFKPSAKLSYALVFATRAPRGKKALPPLAFDVAMQVDFGHGKPPAFPDSGPTPGGRKVKKARKKKASAKKK